jgi:hypothetical protein
MIFIRCKRSERVDWMRYEGFNGYPLLISSIGKLYMQILSA